MALRDIAFESAPVLRDVRHPVTFLEGARLDETDIPFQVTGAGPDYRARNPDAEGRGRSPAAGSEQKIGGVEVGEVEVGEHDGAPAVLAQGNAHVIALLAGA